MKVQSFLLILVFVLVACSSSRLKKNPQTTQENLNPINTFHPFAKKWDNKNHVWKKVPLKK